MTPQMREVLFVVPRASTDEVTVAIVTAWVPPRIQPPQRFRDALRRVLTRWVIQTPHGRQAWASTSHDLNIGDLVEWQAEPGLRRCLTAQGIHRLRVQTYCSLDSPTAWVFDEILVNEKAPDLE